ncbi:LacI family DNA-binding transcriptional regulator [Streptomyces griseorubiginosus]|uniref:LacI family DNA-binding transcriptional regulator n=1 Tax=Streptomyces griseorubiginosus TaxID=67304 RepID=UPI002E7FE502|nr:LacI family DNA-binding transcriptional regulator [Streptomyces griseorubiginosus]WUB47890.1 LacI family transcriptional regulator [Streptomyces griseorubiginosus]WUB56416.1 LacI family transcriptional regulator [Streptomyces griseorubiginosus]
MATMADVARSAGVSVATVSHVLNGTRPVLPHTRQAVLDAVDELGYTPNTLARSLVTSRTRSIGLAVSAISNPYFTEILQGVEAGALEHGYSLLIADPHDDPVHERKVVQLLHERRVDGMIVAPSADPRELLAYLARHEVPTVFLDRVVDAAAETGGDGSGDAGTGADGPRDTGARTDGPRRFDQVCAENVEPMAELVTHLAALGHRRIGLVAGLPGLSTTAERITGYRQGLAASGLPYDAHLVVHGDSESPGAERATAALLSLAAPPTALVTANNSMTIGTLRALRERGLSVPDDLALCCFDDFAWADLFSPRLTAIAQPSREIGAQAVRVLLDRLAAPDRPTRTLRLPCALVHRTSCGCAETGEYGRPAPRCRSSRPSRSPQSPLSSQSPRSSKSPRSPQSPQSSQSKGTVS